MISNTNGMDRIVRVIIGLGLLAVAWMYMASLGTLGAGLIGIVGVVLLATAALGWCPLYKLLGISTAKSD